MCQEPRELTWRLIRCLLPVVAVTILPACATQDVNSSSSSTPSMQATISADSKVWAFSFLPGSFVAVTIDSVDGQKVGSRTSKVYSCAYGAQNSFLVVDSICVCAPANNRFVQLRGGGRMGVWRHA
jgi:hypothetical protein